MQHINRSKVPMKILQRFDHREKEELYLALLKCNTIVLQFFHITLHSPIIRILRNRNELLFILIVVKYFNERGFSLVYLYQVRIKLSLIKYFDPYEPISLRNC